MSSGFDTGSQCSALSYTSYRKLECSFTLVYATRQLRNSLCTAYAVSVFPLPNLAFSSIRLSNDEPVPLRPVFSSFWLIFVDECKRRSNRHRMLSSILSYVALAASWFGEAEAFWRMNCAVIQTGRVDPIVNPGDVAQHCHTIVGGSSGS